MLNILFILLPACIILESQRAIAELLQNIFYLDDILICIQLTLALVCLFIFVSFGRYAAERE